MEVDGDTASFELKDADQERFRAFYKKLVSEDDDEATIRFFTHPSSSGVILPCNLSPTRGTHHHP